MKRTYNMLIVFVIVSLLFSPLTSSVSEAFIERDAAENELERAGNIIFELLNLKDGEISEELLEILDLEGLDIEIAGFYNQSNIVNYSVRAGDTLYKLAQEFESSVDKIMEFNNLDSHFLYVGQELKIPSGDELMTYVVRPGDSLYQLSQKFDLSIERIREYNDWYLDYIYIGQRLIIPIEEIEKALTYHVKAGDTLYRLAQKYNTTVEEIKEASNISTDYLSIGQKLTIPYKKNTDDSNEEGLRLKINDEEEKLMARAVYSEARGEPYEGQVAVAAVVINRVLDPIFPDTIREVIFQPWQFTAVHDGQFWLEPNDDAYRAANAALEGWDPSEGAVYYYNPRTATSDWVFHRKVIVRIGSHYFAV